MLFNYMSGIPEKFNRKGGYLPGNIAKTGWKEVESMNSARPDIAIEFGSVVKRVIEEGKSPYVSNIEEDEDYAHFFGIAVSDVTSQSVASYDLTSPKYINKYFSGSAISVMTEGYIVVPVQQGIPIVGEQVYVRVAPSLTNPNLPIGGIEALADVGNIAWKNVVFESGAFYPFNGTSNSPNEEEATSQCAIIRVELSRYGLMPLITSAPNDITITYGTLPKNVVLQGGSATYGGEDIEGEFVLNNPNYIFNVGEYDTTCTFIPKNPAYEKVTNIEIGLRVLQATPTIIRQPIASSNLYYGDGLFELQLVNGLATTEGVFSWEEENTRPQESGPHNVIFFPFDTTNYLDVNNIQVNVNVVKVPTVVREQPVASAIASGSALSTSAISGGIVTDFREQELAVAGAWAWENGDAVVNASGIYTAVFTPTNTDKYEPVTTQIQVNVQ